MILCQRALALTQGREVRTNYKSVRPETKQGKEHSRRYYNSPHTKNDRY